MNPTPIVVAVLAVFAVQQAAAPREPMPTTPAACVKWVQDQHLARQRAAGPLTAEILARLTAERTASAKACAAQFDPARASGPDVVPLVQLLVSAGEIDLAKTTLARALAQKGLPEADRAAVLFEAVNAGLREPKSAERNARLEEYVAALDGLSDAVFTQKLDAHARMNSYYRADDIDAGIIKHSTWIIAAVNAQPPDRRARLAGVTISAHENLAEAWAGQGKTGEAIALLERGLREWPEASPGRLKSTLDRYHLVGTEAAAITAPRWLNTPAGTKDLSMKGHVTLLEFTAHWCGPCKESYPGLKRLLARYGPQGFRIVLATQLYGYFGSDRGLAPDAEIDRDREYFKKEGLDVPIAIADKAVPMVRNADGTYTPSDPNDARYKVGGIPQIHLIDRQGRIRLIMVGYDEANEGRLARLIEQYLRER